MKLIIKNLFTKLC